MLLSFSLPVLTLRHDAAVVFTMHPDAPVLLKTAVRTRPFEGPTEDKVGWHCHFEVF
jgi:hypothetical protein